MSGDGMHEALDLTVHTINRRAAGFRNLVVAVVGVILGSALWAVAAGRWMPLLGLVLLVPFCAGFAVRLMSS